MTPGGYFALKSSHLLAERSIVEAVAEHTANCPSGCCPNFHVNIPQPEMRQSFCVQIPVRAHAPGEEPLTMAAAAMQAQRRARTMLAVLVARELSPN